MGTVDEVVATDVVVVGAGVAGLSVALRAGPEVTLLAKEEVGLGGSTPLAQGGVAAALGPGDAPACHASDTLAVAGGLADEEAVAVLVDAAGDRLGDLQALGAHFETDAAGRLVLAREGGHSRARVAHARGDATGREVASVLAGALGRAAAVRVVPGATAHRLLVGRGRVAGVVATGGDGRATAYLAGATVLATGGLGHLYARTTNPPGATGEGLALAAAAGARLVDLEFVQFHPTALDVAADPVPLVTEALRGAGATLLDGRGRAFMAEEHPAADLAGRDVVARAIWRRVAAGEVVRLDLRGVVGLAERFPTVVAACRAHGLDPAAEPVPVTPAAHYHMGGVATDTWGRTSVPGLWAVGEVACTGVHGANRLASNSLLEGLVFGRRAATDVGARRLPTPTWGEVAASAGAPGPPEAADWWPELRRRLWSDVGLVRDRRGLEATLAWLGSLGPGAAAPAVVAARAVTAAALARRESRGAHYRADHPLARPGWARRLPAPGPARALEAVGG